MNTLEKQEANKFDCTSSHRGDLGYVLAMVTNLLAGFCALFTIGG
jgi:hypothetical protein